MCSVPSAETTQPLFELGSNRLPIAPTSFVLKVPDGAKEGDRLHLATPLGAFWVVVPREAEVGKKVIVNLPTLHLNINVRLASEALALQAQGSPAARGAAPRRLRATQTSPRDWRSAVTRNQRVRIVKVIEKKVAHAFKSDAHLANAKLSKLATDFESKVFNSASSREEYVKRICNRWKAVQAAPTQRLEKHDD